MLLGNTYVFSGPENKKQHIQENKTYLYNNYSEKKTNNQSHSGHVKFSVFFFFHFKTKTLRDQKFQ